MILDAVIGLVLLGAVLTALITALTQHRKLARVLADQRAAVRALETAAINLWAGDAADASIEGFEVATVEHARGWVELVVEHDRGRQSLFVRPMPLAEGGAR